jgi:hypothetical protein
MSTNIRFKRSDIPGKVPSLDSIDLGELALNTADGKLFTKQEMKGPPGSAAIQKIIEIGAAEVPNVLYVAKNGDDSNSGKTLGQSFLTLKKALSIATPGTTIFLKSGEYIEDNPLRVPARVSIVGDNLRNTTVRPKNPTKDIFWVYNGAYIFCMNFKGHIAPSAAVCFPPDGSAGEIVTSPYTQAVTSITTTGTGMRVDGAVTTGLRSMVCDAFTQYNQGGIGIHMLNRGNTQLVSIFTICCDISFMCENGGFCSVNLSNSSFGNYGLVSRGASEPLYRGVVKKSAGRQITFKNLAKRPNIGDGVLFADYNQATCNRDNGLIVDSLAFDLLYEGTTQSTFSGLRYWAKDDITTGIQQQAQTAAAIKRAQIAATKLIENPSAAGLATFSPNNSASVVNLGLTTNANRSTAKRIVSEEFEIVSRIITEGPVSPSLLVGPDLDAAEPEYKVLRETVLDRKAVIVDDTIKFIKTNYPSVTFIESKCKRDIAFVIDAVADDMILGTNYKSIKAAVTYLTATPDNLTIDASQTRATIEAFKFARDKIVPIVQEEAVLLARVQANFEIITTALEDEADGGGNAYIADLLDPTSSDANKLVFPAQQDTESTVLNLVKNLQYNKDFVKAEVIDYINRVYPTVVAYGYNETTCARDIGYAIDAICYDLVYGGNSQTLDAAKRYFNYASGLSQLRSSEEVPATVDAYGRTQLFAQRVVILDAIESTQNNESQVFAVSGTDLVATTQTQVNRLGALFSIFLKQLATDIVGTSDFIQPNGKRLSDANLDEAYNILQANKQWLRNDVVNYLARAYPGFDFDKVKCSRDVGYIVDSICFDLVHGGNRQAVTAGIYYFDFNEESNVLKSVLPKQIKQTVNAYKYMKELLRDVLSCSPVPNPWQGAVPQRIDLPPATGSEVVAVGNLIDIINEILQEGPNNSEDSIQRLKQPIGLTASTDPNKIRAFDLLMANRDFIQAEMLAYININWYTISDGDTQFARVNTATDLTLGTTTTGYPTVTYQPTVYKAIRDAVLAAKEDIKTETIKFMANSFFDNFSFNKPKCYRDVGLILDAILSDMIFGSNYKTITAAISYLRAYASEVVGAQKVQTVASLKAAKEITLKRIVNPQAKEEISTRFDIIIGILDGARTSAVTGLTETTYAVPALSYPIPVRNNEEDLDRKTAVDILRANVDFIKEEIVSYIDANFTLNEFDREKCARDVGFIIDALGYDLMFLSNFRAITAGRSYLRANTAKVTGNQKLATLGSFRHLKKLLVEVVKSNSLAVNSIQRGMDIILEILDKGESAVPKYIIPFPEKGRSVEFKRARDLVEKNRDFIIDDVLTYVNTPGLEILPGAVTFEKDVIISGVQTFKTAGEFVFDNTFASWTPTNEISVGDLIRVSGSLFGTSSIGGYASPSTYKVSSLTVSGNDIKFTLVNLDGSALETAGGLTGKTTSMRFELVKTGDYAIPAGFDFAKCRRDLNLILDAVYYDVTYGGTLESRVAAESYFVGAVSQLGDQSDEIAATIRAYDYLRTVVKQVAQDAVWAPAVGNTTIQTRSPNGSDGSANAAREMSLGIDLILNLLNEDSTAANNILTQASLPNLDWVDPKAVAAHRALQAAKETTKEAVTDYVDENYVLFGYDRDKCKRDVGYVVEAVAYDLLFNSNVRSTIAGRSYYRAMASVVVKDQKTATLASFQYLKDKLLELVKPVDADNPTPAESLATQRVSRSMDIVLKILENGLAAEPTFLLTDPTDTDPAVVDRLKARTIVEANRDWIEEELIDWIDNYITTNSLTVSYSETACRRDIEYILDAVRYDLTYGGNLETLVAARAYYGGTSDVNLALGSGEQALTEAAYAQLATLIQDVAEGTATGQPTTTNPATDGTVASDLINYIVSYIDNPTTFNFTTELVEPDDSWTDVNIRPFYDKLRDTINVTRLKTQVTDFVDLNFAYNRDKCARDVGFLIDALCYDLLYGGNVDTTQAAIAYFDGAVTPKSTIPKQIIQTVAAYERLKDVLSEVVQLKQVTVSSNKFEAKSRILDSMAIVIDVLRDGQGAAPARPFVMPIPTAGTANAFVAGFRNARNLVQANREFIKRETIAYIDNQPSPPAYNRTTCERDIDLILDAVLYDLTYAGTTATTLAAEAYYTASTTLGAGEVAATAAGFTYMASVIESVCLAQRVDSVSVEQNRVVQIISTAGTVGAAAAARALIDDIIVEKINGNVIPAADPVDTTWVAEELLDVEALFDATFATSVKTKVNTLITTKFPDITYTGATKTNCEEDIDAVIAAVKADLLFGSNYRSQLAGNAYYRAVTGAENVLANQKDASVATFELLRDAFNDKLNAAIPDQNTSGQAGSLAAGQHAESLINTVVAYIDNTVADPTEDPAGTDWVDADLVTLSTSLDTNKTTVKQSITTYISDRFPELDYSTADCEEDIVSIIDAVRYDMMFNSNFRTITAARAYFRAVAAKAVGEQKIATLEAFRLLKEKLADLVSTNATAAERVADRMDLLIRIVDKGEAAIPAYSVPSPTGYNTTYLPNYGYARNLIESNRAFLKLEVFKKLRTDPTLNTLAFNEAKCERDLDLILDAVYYDMTYDGNMESIIAGGAYYRGTRAGDLGVGQTAPISGDDVNATIVAYQYLAELVLSVAQGKDVSQLQVVIPQTLGEAGSIAGAQTAKNLAYVVRNLVNSVGTYAVATPTFVSPNVSWVEPSLKVPNDLIELYLTSDPAVTGYAGRFSIAEKLTEWVKVQQRMASPNDTVGARTAFTPDSGPLANETITPVGAWDLWFTSNTAVAATSVVAGQRYKIATTASAATTFGASANSVDTVFIATATGSGTGTFYELFNYDIAKCERDVALVQNAVRYDMMFGTNFRTVTAATSYWRQQANTVLASGSTTNSEYPQTEQSILLFTYMKELLQNLPDTTPKAGATVDIPGITSGSVAHTRIGTLMDLLLDVLDAVDLDDVNDKVAALKPYNLPLPSGGANNSKDAGFRAARDLIEANRDFIKAELFAWIDQQKRENRDGFVVFNDGGTTAQWQYDRTACSEDLDLILDAVFYDLTYGGNMESYTAGLAYYAGTGQDSLPAEEREATIRVYNQLGSILFDIARSVEVTVLQQAIEQVKGTSGSIETAQKLGQLVDIVINVVKGGVKQVPQRVEPEFLAGDETLAYVRIAVQEQKQELQARIADYIDAFILQYNTEKCARDVGLILDAAMYDMVLNSNFQSITAGSVYLQKAANVVTSTQIGPQLQAIKFIRDKVIAISQTPPLVKNEAAIGRITNLFDTMFDIIDKGVEVAPEVVNIPPLGAAFNQNAVNAANSILANKEFLKEEVVAYITANYKTYDQSRCSRDVGLIIDAALYDLLLDTNYNSVKAGLAYRRATSSLVVTDQLQETLGGIDFAKQKVVELLDDADAIASVTRSFELISSIIGGGSVPTARVPLPGGSVRALPRPSGLITRDPAFQAAAAALRTAKSTLQTAVTDWISSQESAATAASDGSIWDGFTYDDQKCEEDVGFIIDAIAYDLTYGGNMETITAGYAYYIGTTPDDSITGDEVPATLAAYAYLAEQVKATVAAATGASEQAAEEASNLVLLVRNLIDSRANSVAGARAGDQSWVDPLLQEINQTIIQEKSRLQDVIIDYVNNIATYTNNAITTPADYDNDKCRRDVGLVLDAVRTDLMFGTNFRTINAGRSYRRSFADVITGAQNSANINSFIELKERVLGKKLTSVTIANTTGNFTCANSATVDVTPLFVNQPVRVSGVYTTASNPIVGYTNLATQPKTYYIISTNGTTTFQLSDSVGGAAITTVAGATSGLTFEIRPSLESLDEVITQGLLDVEVQNALVAGEALVLGQEYKIKSIGEQTVAAGNFVNGGLYEIVDPGTTPWSSIGFTGVGSAVAGDTFTATDVGSGTGTAKFITDYTLYGARDNNVGTVFMANATPNTTTGGTGQVETVSFRQRAERLFDLFIAILEDDATEIEGLGYDNDSDYNVPVKQGGDATDGYFYLLTPPPSGDGNASVASILAARDAINANRESLEDDLITWINAQIAANTGAGAGNFSSASGYDEVTCRKDIKLVLDAIAYDLTFGGNLETIVAGKAYYDGTALGAGELLATIDAYNYLKTLIEGVTASGDGRTAALQLVDDLISYIDPKIEDPVLVEADTSWVDSELYVFSDKLKAAANSVATDTTNFVTANYPALAGYDVAKCQRDVKLVIDAVRWDMMFNSNFRTIVAARSYYRSQVVTGDFTTGSLGTQKPATIAAFGVVKVALDEIVKSDVVAQTRVAALMQLVLDILASESNIPAVSTPYGGTPNAVDIGYLNARDRIEENRDFIIEDMRAYLLGTTANGGLQLTSGTSFGGNFTTDECLRDVELILDAVRYDMTYGGNMESVLAGKAYYAGTVLGATPPNAAHITATESAYTRLAAVLEDIATNTTVTTITGFSGPAQVTSNDPGSDLAAAQAKALVDTVKSYVGTSSVGDVAEVRPTTSWVDNNLALFSSTMLDRKDSLALQVTDYITAQFPTLTYTVETCQRDVKLVVEAVRYDMMFGTNFRSWTAGKSYYRNMTSAGVVTSTQKEATLASFRYLKGLLAAIVGNNITAGHRVKSAMNVVIDTLEYGPTTRNADDDRIQAAVEAIEAGKDSLLADMGTWLDTADNSYTFANYDKTTCLRDIGYLIDAIKYDLTYGGNMETVVAGKAYYDGAVLESGDAAHITATQAAFTELADKIKALSGVAASVGVIVDGLVANANDLIDDATSVTEVVADASWAETPIQEVNVAMRLQANTIKSQVTNYVDTNFPALVYDDVKCARDVGLLIDAVRWDMLFNSNFRSITAGRSYYRNSLNLDADALASLNQKQATVAAFTYLKSVLQGVASTNAIAAERVTSSMDTILEIIENGLGDQANPTITYGTVADAERAKAKTILLANKEFIKDEVIAYINDTYTQVQYDEVKCARDVELITYAVAYDMVTGSNYQTVTAALGYLRGNASAVLAAEQAHITLLAFKYLKNLLTNYVGGNSTAVASVKASMDIIIDAVYTGAAWTAPTLTITAITNGVLWTASDLATNRSTIVTDTIGDLTGADAAAYAALSAPNQAKCQRDLGFIIDALQYDLTYGGNWASTINARSYYVGTTNQLDPNANSAAEVTATLAALEALKSNVNGSISGTYNSVTASARANTLIDIIIDVIENGLDAVPETVYPELVGANNALEAARNILISNVANAKAKTVRWVNNRAYFVYDIVKCERDIGLILDAVFTDVVTNSNFLSLQAGRAYLRSSAAGAIAAPQKWAILAGLTYAKSVLTTLVSTNTTIVDRIRDRLANIIDVINDETDANVALTFTTDTTTASSVADRKAAHALVVGAKATLVADVLADVATDAATPPGYDAVACERDLGLIVDAISHDILYGGDWGVTVAAKAYWEGGSLNLGTNEREATFNAIENLRVRINTLLAPAGDAFNTALINRIKAVLDNADTAGFTGATDLAESNALAITAPSTAGATQANIDSKAVLVAAKDASTYKILENINSREYLDYTGATVTKCERDVNLIITALSLDVPAGSNFKSIKAAQAYLRSYSKVVTEEQKAATIGSLYFIKKKVSEALTSTAKTDARALMDTIIDIVDRGILATPAITITPTASSNEEAASDTLDSNANFIKAEIRAYLDRNYPELDYNKIKCERDVQYILDALRYDLVYGGNVETLEAALSYWEGNELTLGSHPTNIDDVDVTGGEDEKVATVAAYGYLADLVKIVLNDTAYTPLQTVTTAGTHTSGAENLATDAEGLIDDLVLVINNEAESLDGTDSANAVADGLRAQSGVTANTTIAGLTSLDTDVSTEILAAFTDQFFVYNETKCARDVGFIVEALAFDALYAGNKESRTAALEYAYKGGLMIPLATKGPTVGGFTHLKNIIDDIVSGTSLTATTGNSTSQTTTAPSSLTGVSDLVQITLDVIKGGAAAAPALVDPVFADVDGYKPDNLVVRAIVRDSIESIAAQTITYINETYAGFGYLQDTCKRDVGLTLDAVAYDLIYGGNSRTKFAAEQYYSGGRFQIPADSKSATVACFVQLDALVRKVIANDSIVTFQNYVDQDKSNPAATNSEISNVSSLFDAFTDILTNGYISVVQLDATFNGSVDDNTYATFHQVSTITTTGHTLEWVGTGIDVDSALPYNGGVPKPENQLVSEKGGFINFTSTDEKGDFRIGPDLTIKRDSGSIVGRAFNKSLLGVVTPYILALQS